MKPRVAIVALVAFLIIVGLGGAWFTNLLSASIPGVGHQTEFIISPAEPAGQVINRLASQHLIKSALAARLYSRLTELDSRLRPGAYLVSASQSTPELLRSLTQGPKDLWVTIPEGWRREQIAARLTTVLGSQSQFDPQLFLSTTSTLEGRLFPDTYLIPTYATTTDIIKIFTDNFYAKTNSPSYAEIILASLVEREARHAPDRPIIAGIFKKRLEAGWPLQVDATVQYALDSSSCQNHLLDCDWWDPPQSTDFESPFNTYLHLGLPPTPIANPGLASIEAVMHSSSSPYWYYLTDSEGVTHFSVTLTEHNFNIDKYLRP